MQASLLDITERVAAAAAARTPLHIRGGASKAFAAPVPPGVALLDTRAHAGIVDYEPSELVVTARAGTPLAELEALLASQQQCLPFEPPHGGPGATVGGMVAAGLSGPARASVGAVRDFVLGVSMVNGRGEALTFGGQVMKNVAGYDVSRLMAGSWGTLGVLTEVSLKVLPVPPAQTTLAFDCTQAEALAWLNGWGGLPLPLNASCWVADGPAQGGASGGVSNGINGVKGGRLYVRLRGAVAAVDAACRTMGGERQDSASVQADWDACREQQLPWFAERAPTDALWRLSLPQTAPELRLPAGVSAPMVEWHGALRWVQAAPAHGPALHALARDAGGSASLFRAPNAGSISARPDFDDFSPALQTLHTQLRQAFDPAGIFVASRHGQR